MNACSKIVKDRTSKKSRVASGDSVINDVHDNVLSHIFSRIPLEDAVRTSILSKDWKYKWTSLYKLVIDDRHWDANPQSFIGFLNRTLPSIQCLRIFQLRCVLSAASAVENDFQRWFSAVLEHNLENFVVELFTQGGLVLPASLLNSTSLRQLSFRAFRTTLKVEAKNIAPKLTHLHLWSVNIVSGSPTLTFTFPVLETLTLIHHEWLNVKSVEIHAPSLTTLRSSPRSRIWNNDYEYSIVIFAPRITIFDCGVIPERMKVNPSSPSSVVSAYLLGQYDLDHPELSIRKDVDYRVRKLLNQFTSLEELFLHGCLVKESWIAVPLCRYAKLTRLTLDRQGSLELLFELLHAAPSLKFMCLWVCKWRAYNYKAWEPIPACIASQLEEVVFDGFYEKAPEYDLAKFLLKNAEQLKNFRIHLIDPRKSKEQVIERLSTMPRCSTSTTIDVVSVRYKDGRFDHGY